MVKNQIWCISLFWSGLIGSCFLYRYIVSVTTHTLPSKAFKARASRHLQCCFPWVQWRKPSEAEDKLAAPCSHASSAPSSKRLLSSLRVSGAVSDVCARMEVVWRAWLCPQRHICQYLPLSSLRFMAATRSLGLLILLMSLVSALQHPNTIFVCLCVCVCVHSWRRCADESLISRNQRLRRTAPLLENISRYVFYIWNLYFRYT